MQFDELSNRLKGIEDASLKGYPIKYLYRLMCRTPEIWQEAIANIYANKGAITKGVSDHTLSGFSSERVDHYMQALREQRYSFKPVKRVYIPKKNGKKRPLGISTGDDKLVQEVVRIILERIYEPIFSDLSHGFRPHRSCHTALSQVRKTWKGIKWFIEIDISGFFDSVDHKILLELLKKKIKDKGFISLIEKMLKAGYLEQWTYHRTFSGVPQGGICSPILSNIYLHELDLFVVELMKGFNKGRRRRTNPEYKRLSYKRKKLRERIDQQGFDEKLIKQFHETGKRMREIPSIDTKGSDYKRLKYCRYADDFILGITGTKEDALQIMQKVIEFLSQKLNLQISQEKSRIESAKKGVKFLSYQIHTWRSDKTLKMKVGGRQTTKRTITEHISLQVPQEKVMEFCAKNRYGDWSQTKPLHRARLLNLSDLEIIMVYNAELRGLANYYCLADDAKSKLNKLFYLAEYSFLKTLANKHKTKQSAIRKKLKSGNELIYKYDLKGQEKEVRFFKLRHMSQNLKSWEIDEIPKTISLIAPESELVRRINASECEYCGRKDLEIQLHHVGKLKDLRKNPSLKKWQKVMIARNRKTIFLCSGTKESCHYLLHRGQLPDNRFNHPWTSAKWT